MRASAAVISRFRFGELAKVVRRVIGVPDYDVYIAHQQSCHPEDEPISREAFAQEALARRYERPGSRCC